MIVLNFSSGFFLMGLGLTLVNLGIFIGQVFGRKDRDTLSDEMITWSAEVVRIMQLHEEKNGKA